MVKNPGGRSGANEEMFIFIYKVEQTITFEQNFYKKFLQHYYNHKLNKMAVLVV